MVAIVLLSQLVSERETGLDQVQQKVDSDWGRTPGRSRLLQRRTAQHKCDLSRLWAIDGKTDKEFGHSRVIYTAVHLGRKERQKHESQYTEQGRDDSSHGHVAMLYMQVTSIATRESWSAQRFSLKLTSREGRICEVGQQWHRVRTPAGRQGHPRRVACLTNEMESP